MGEVMSNESSNSGDIGVGGLLLVLFIGLKLTGHIAWSWWWVLSPLWMSVALMLAVLGAYALIALVIVTVSDKGKK